LYRERK